MYYVIETHYAGPNQDTDEYVDADTIDISTSPAISNSDCEERLDGWCGETNGWSVYAHGAYATLEDARKAITDKWGDVREGESGQSYEDVIETYKPGKYAPMSAQATADWAHDGLQYDISADTTDGDIAALITKYEAEANDQGGTLDKSALEGYMEDRRQELRDELAAED